MARKKHRKNRKRKTRTSTTQNSKRRKTKRKSEKQSMVSRYVFTVNAKKEEGGELELMQWYNNLEALFEEKKTHLRYICGQLELENNAHFQGYLQLKRSQRLSWLKNNIHPTAHYEVQKAYENDDARHYTMKPVVGCSCEHCLLELEDRTSVPDTWVEYGIYSTGQGTRLDIEGYVQAIKDGNRRIDLINSGFAKQVALYPSLYSYINEVTAPIFRTVKRQVILLYGYSGKGKSILIQNLLEDVSRTQYGKKMRSKGRWFNGYDQQKYLLIEEFEGGMERTDFKDIFDPWNNTLADVKNSTVWVSADVVYITSNKHPLDWWRDLTDVETAAIKRRLTKIYYFSIDAELGVPTNIFETEDEIAEFMDFPHRYPTDVLPIEIINYHD